MIPAPHAHHTGRELQCRPHTITAHGTWCMHSHSSHLNLNQSAHDSYVKTARAAVHIASTIVSIEKGEKECFTLCNNEEIINPQDQSSFSVFIEMKNMKNDNPDIGNDEDEEYQLEVQQTGARISCSSRAGMLYGMISLAQMVFILFYFVLCEFAFFFL